MLIKIAIILIPTIAYFIFWIFTNKLINSKINNTESKKKYKKVFREHTSDIFAPIFLIAVVIIFVFFTKEDKTTEDGFDMFYIVMKFILLIPLIGIAIIKLKYVKAEISNLKTKSEFEITKNLK
ncbi:hypothetical protein [Flavobacterium sp. LB2R40]|uniref:hypothetical protein n=1 Tax=Flavobacterium sp. LB2R40 TaxID=3401722 RepID=UPI003AAA815A